MRQDSFVAKKKRYLCSDFAKPSQLLVFSNSGITEISVFSSRRKLVKIETTSKLREENAETCSKSLQQIKMSL